MNNSDFFGFFNGICGEPEDIEKELNQKWRDACMNGRFDEYERHKELIKCGGAKVYRNSNGIHKVVR